MVVVPPPFWEGGSKGWYSFDFGRGEPKTCRFWNLAVIFCWTKNSKLLIKFTFWDLRVWKKTMVISRHILKMKFPIQLVQFEARGPYGAISFTSTPGITTGFLIMSELRVTWCAFRSCLHWMKHAQFSDFWWPLCWIVSWFYDCIVQPWVVAYRFCWIYARICLLIV